ncbi:MAG TPA: DUF4160 domain-containing protein [Hyphomonadaceae bacterium]|jgi:hypothetical protein|nr:DUF4160 domain-containing protein [Hyphomonadaceae bacterium]
MADTSVNNTTVEVGDLFLMANVHPRRSGLPFVVYISEKQGQHDVRVKVAEGPRAPPFVASVSVRPEIEVVAGELSAGDLALVRRWIELNRDVIIGYWDRTIEDTADALNALQPLPPE